MSPEARDHSLDELASGLASGTLSRGKALRLMAAALLGGALSFTPKVAEALPQAVQNPHKCNSKGECATGSCCAGTCCGVGAEGTPAGFVSCVPVAESVCGPGRVGTGCYRTIEAPEEFTCLANCGGGTPCTASAQCPSGMVCAARVGRSDFTCFSLCRKGGGKR
jgi:hypothetical protein